MKEIKKYSQILNAVQGAVGSIAGAIVMYKPELMEAVSPTTGFLILAGVAALNGYLTKIKQNL